MICARIRGCTRIIGKSQGYLGLPLRDEPYPDTASGIIAHSMVTAWTPTPAELEALNNGANIEVRILARPDGHPPIIVGVGESP